jgi:hypothetical protein
MRRRSERPLTPLVADAFEQSLRAAGLTSRYPTLVPGLRSGFHVGFPPISAHFAPLNSKSLLDHPAFFSDLAQVEFVSGRWLGPFPEAELRQALGGSFHSSPCSVLEKIVDPDNPHIPTKKRLIQNYSYPHSPTNCISSINSHIDIEAFPCTWGTPACLEFIIWTLPPGCEIAIRDVKGAYRNVPLHPSQWAAAVVRVDATTFALDTNGAFGVTSMGGVWGLIADAFCDIMRARGIGPLLKWVDDFVFIRMRREHIARYNHRRARARAGIEARPELQPRQKRGSIWWEGADLAEGGAEHYVEDLALPVADLVPEGPPPSSDDAAFAYGMHHIDNVSDTHGIIWGEGKTLPFASANPYMGFIWDVQRKTVSISSAKLARLLDDIATWRETGPRHDLLQAQKLHGRLQHMCFIVPAGRAYLTTLQRFMGVFVSGGHDQHKRLTPPRGTPDDLRWWEQRLSAGPVIRDIRGPRTVVDVGAYSDASSAVGIGVVIGGRWRAWRLLPGWRASGDRDIQWAEAIGFELLCHYAFERAPANTHLRIWGDNTAVVEGWWRGRSGNVAVNDVFKRVVASLETARCTVLTEYVRSAENPADEPSRGAYGPGHRCTWATLLPPLPIPSAMAEWVVNFDAPTTGAERTARQLGTHMRELKRINRAERRSRRDVLAEVGTLDPDAWDDDAVGGRRRPHE